MRSRILYFSSTLIVFASLLALLVGCATARLPQASDDDLAGGKEIVYQSATVDRLGHLYYANEQNRITKLNGAGDSIGYYANNSFGKISTIDATNPLKVLVYYPDFYSGVVLDRQLNETQQFNMLDLGYGEIRVIASSIDGAMWIFNDHEQRLIKATQQGQVLQKGEDLRLRFNERLLPSKIVQAGDELYIQVPERGLLVFDLFGQFKTQILATSIQGFQIYGKQLLLRQNDQITIHDRQEPGKEVRSLEISVDPHEKILLSNQFLLRINRQSIIRDNFKF